ncbi:MAG: AAA family ATPase [Clostridia bacterium]|jgi:cytidylate kinase|nr:AAA family ATPase [Clostridia bacterium]
MIITVDGYDGTGKTTLAKSLAKKYGFIYLDKPIIKMMQCQKECSFEEAVLLVKEAEAKLRINPSKRQITKFYCDALLWLKQFGEKHNIILDRGFLTMYAVVGDNETEDLFDQYIKAGAFFDASIYLTAKDEERVNRIYGKNPNDPDLKHPVKWHDNNLESYATSRNLNYYKINTDNKTPEQVFDQAVKIVNKELEQKRDNELSI